MHRMLSVLFTPPFALCADRGGELFFKTLDLRSACQPPRAQRGHDFIYFCFLQRGAKEWNLKFGHRPKHVARKSLVGLFLQIVIQMSATGSATFQNRQWP